MAGEGNDSPRKCFYQTCNEFKLQISNYAVFCEAPEIPGIAENVRDIRDWVDEQKAAHNVKSQNENITKVGKVLETSIDSLQSIASGEPARVMKGSLGIVFSIASVVGGPYGAAAGAICGVLGSILSLSTPNKPDMASVFIENVREEFRKFNQNLQSQTFEGLQARVKTMNLYLKSLKNASASTDPNGLQEPMDHELYTTSFPQFIGAVSVNFSKGLARNSKKEDADDCVRSMVMYCNAQTSLLVLLANILATFKSIGRPTIFIQSLIDSQKEDAVQKLGFLSDEKYFTGLNLLPAEVLKLMISFHLRGNISAYIIVEAFRESLKMTKMQDLETIQLQTLLAMCSGVKLTVGKFPQPQSQGDDHYFQFINDTEFPARVICGTAGDHINGLDFTKVVNPRSSYEHVATRSGWTFSAGGYFIIYLDGKLRPFDKKFEGNIKVYEFALSNPFIGMIKANLLDKTSNVMSVSGRDCWNQMSSNCADDYFTHSCKYYVVYGGYTGIYHTSKFCGKNGCRTWRFGVQEFDSQEMAEPSCIIL